MTRQPFERERASALSPFVPSREFYHIIHPFRPSLPDLITPRSILCPSSSSYIPLDSVADQSQTLSKCRISVHRQDNLVTSRSRFGVLRHEAYLDRAFLNKTVSIGSLSNVSLRHCWYETTTTPVWTREARSVHRSCRSSSIEHRRVPPIPFGVNRVNRFSPLDPTSTSLPRMASGHQRDGLHRSSRGQRKEGLRV